MRSKRAVLFLFTLTLGSFISAESALAARSKKPCHLYLVSDNDAPSASTKTFTENNRYLHFIRDLKKLGVQLDETSPEKAKLQFQELSRENLKAFLENYKAYIRSNRPQAGFKEPEALESPLGLWRDFHSPAQGFNPEIIKTDQQHLKEEGSSYRSMSLLSLAIDGFSGVTFNLGFLDQPTENFVNESQNNGIARVGLKSDFKTDWAYALPMPGSHDSSVPTIDARSLAFLYVFAPEHYKQFFSDFSYFFPHGEVDPNDPMLDEDFDIENLAYINSSQEGLRALSAWRQNYSELILTLEDASTLLKYIQAQTKEWKTTSGPVDPFFAFKDHIQSLTVVISGEIPSSAFILKDRPFVPPSLSPWGSSGMKRRVGPLGSPNMTGDGLFIPNKPDMH